MNILKLRFIAFTIVLPLIFMSAIASAKVVEYNLEIEQTQTNITGKTVMAMTVNKSLPAPTLTFTEGDTAVIHVHNKMNVESSIHWHGILLPNREDGVSYLTTPPIKAHSSHTFRFRLVQSGTYWYHSHTGLQEQRGVYGAIVIKPKRKPQTYQGEAVLVLSDWTNENPNEILRTLKRGNHYYSIRKNNLANLIDSFKTKNFGSYLKNQLKMMPPMDISDVAYDAFLANGKTQDQLKAKPGQWIRLRIVNASASTYFYLEYAKGPLKIISADGIDVKPIEKKRLLIAIAETYDILIQVPKDGRYELRATAQDNSGHTSFYLGSGTQHHAPSIPRPNFYKMTHSGHQAHKHHKGHKMQNPRPAAPYDDLKSVKNTKLDPKRKLREVVLNLTGDMQRYLWTFNGKTLNEDDKIKIHKGENVRFILKNKTMMHHPIHLHGHFFRVVNDFGDHSPLKHTVDVPPHQTVVIEFEASEEKDWFFHCHVLYHMKSGMSRIVSYQNTSVDDDILKIRKNLYKNPIYFWGSARPLSQMSQGQLQLSNTRNDLMFNWEANWTGEFEVDGIYSRYFNRFFSVFGGVNGTEDLVQGVAGVRVLLPLLIESRAWVDTDGDFRFIFEKELAILPRLHAFGDVEYDTAQKWEWSTGAEWVLSKNLSLIGQYHSEFGPGGGIEYRF